MIKKTVLYLLYFFLVFFVIHLTTHSVVAQEFHTDYKVEYFLSLNQSKINTKAKFTISITNLRPDLYVKEFSISFPKSFVTHDIRAYDDHVEINPQISETASSTQIKLAFSDPVIGRNSRNNFYLEFNQDNLFTVSGNIWEVIIPTVEDKKDSTYKIVVHLPPNSQKKISIAKPKPSQIIGNDIIWDNPTAKTIYATFGDLQYYSTNLSYHLDNSQLIPVYTDIAFPPDTLYQQVFVQSISPPPSKVVIDADGNYLGRYYLNPKENKTVTFSGVVATFSKPREEPLSFMRQSIRSQSKYLLSPLKFWQINDVTKIASVKSSAMDIYNFTTNTLQYDFAKVSSNNVRLGAEAVLSKPNQAVCMEFTDLFVAVAREKGIYAREIEGYGFSQDSKLRPLSLASDILHAWPEYYDSVSGYWISVDPTWGNTSGIDYFSDFDLNHIVFAIHGKDSDYPPPAGTYKSENSHDISINATSSEPKEKQSLKIVHDEFPDKINDSQSYQFALSVTNLGNTYVWQKHGVVKSDLIDATPSEFEVGPLAPFQSKTFIFHYKANVKNKSKTALLTIQIPGEKTLSADIKIVPFYYDYAIKISVFLFIALLLGSVLLYRKMKHS